jgi:anti-anti-sigma factor
MTPKPNEFEATVRESVVPGLAVVELRGLIDGRAEEALLRAGAEAGLRSPARMLLDFSGVDYINSTGIALIVGMLSRARQEHREVLVCGLSPHYVEIFHLTKLSDFVTMVANETSLADSTSPADGR